MLGIGFATLWTDAARAQIARGGVEWVTAGGDAQRSSWVRTDPKISVENMRKPGFAVVWKIKLNGDPGLASTLDKYIGYRGFRSFAFMGSSGGEITAIDTDLGRVEWRKTVPGGSPAATSGPCPGGMTAEVTRPTAVAITAPPSAGRSAAGRGRFAKGDVGETGEGAVTLAEAFVRAAAAERAAAANAAAANAGRAGRGPAVLDNIYGAHQSFIDAISADGMFHALWISNGDEPVAPIPFVPAAGNARGLTVIGNVAYAFTSHGCGGAPNGVWALDLTSKDLARWTTSGDIAGGAGFAFGADGTVYAATSGGELVALDGKTLQEKGAYHSGGAAFISTPVVFDYQTKPEIAAATSDGRLHLVDAGSLMGAAFPAAISGDLASWQDIAGARWIVAPSKDAIAAWKISQQDGALAARTGWTSRELASPAAPVVINGVVFTVANAPSPVLYAFEGVSGKELWNSGKAIAAPFRRGALSGSGSQLYLGTSDGTIYAFGFPIEH